jgi:hypothetical protein
MVRLMQGQVTAGLNDRTTHLVAYSAGGVKYRVCEKEALFYCFQCYGFIVIPFRSSDA